MLMPRCWVVGAAVLVVAGSATAQQDGGVYVLPGRYTGTWTNTTFSTTGAIAADVDRLADGSLRLDRVTVSGNVLGAGGVDPFTATWAWDGPAVHWTTSLLDHPVFGDVSGTMLSGGGVTLTGTNVPSAFVAGYTLTGTQTQAALDLSGTIQLSTKGTASSVIHMARSATSRMRSAQEMAGGRYGFAVAGTGGAGTDGAGTDGFGPQIAVGAPMETQNGVARAGRVYIYEAFSERLEYVVGSVGPAVDGLFGYSVAAVPDVNGDGIADWVVGAPGEHPGTNPVGTGRAYIFSGLNGALIWRLIPPTPSAGMSFGMAVAGVEDVNGDGRGDVIVGAPGETVNGLANAGRVYVYSGATGVRLRTITAPTPLANAFFGGAVAGLKDVNGDMRGDILVGAPENSLVGPATGRPGHAYVLSGTTGVQLRLLTSPSNQANGFFGFSVSGVPDANGDGVMDIVVGAPGEHPGASPVNCGRAHLYSGATGSLLFKLLPPSPVTNGNFGYAVAGARDMDGDMRGDVVVGAPGEPGTGGGRAHLYSGISGVRITSLASLFPDAGGHFGAAVAWIPDYGSNGRAEALIGAPMENPAGAPVDCGRAYINRR